MITMIRFQRGTTGETYFELPEIDRRKIGAALAIIGLNDFWSSTTRLDPAVAFEGYEVEPDAFDSLVEGLAWFEEFVADAVEQYKRRVLAWSRMKRPPGDTRTIADVLATPSEKGIFTMMRNRRMAERGPNG